MKSKEKREIYFFSRLAKSIYEDAEALDALHYCRRFTDILRTLQYYGYLTDMTETAGLKCRPELPYLNGMEPRIEERLLDCDRSEIYWKDRTGGSFGSEFLAPPGRTAELTGSGSFAVSIS